MARARNNISRLECEHRLLICDWLADGLPYGDIRSRLASIFKGTPNEGLSIHNSSFLAFQKSEEYKLYRDRKMKIRAETQPQLIDATLINGGRGIESAADVAAMELLRQIQQLSGAGLEVKDIQKLAQAAVSLKRSSSGAKEKALFAELEREKALRKAEVEELQNEIAMLHEKLGNIPVDGSRVVAEMDKQIRGS